MDQEQFEALKRDREISKLDEEIRKLQLESNDLNKNSFRKNWLQPISISIILSALTFMWSTWKSVKYDTASVISEKYELSKKVDSLHAEEAKIIDTLNNMNKKLFFYSTKIHYQESKINDLNKNYLLSVNNFKNAKSNLSRAEYLLLVKRVDVSLDDIKESLSKNDPNSYFNIDQAMNYISQFPHFNISIQKRIKDRIRNEFIINSNLLIKIYGVRIMSLFVNNEYTLEWNKLAIHYIDSSFTSRSIWFDDNIKNEYLFGPRLITDSIYVESIIDLLKRIQTFEKSPLINNLINYVSIYFNLSNFSTETSDRIYKKYIGYLMILADVQHQGYFGSTYPYYNGIDENEKLTNCLDLNCFQIMASYFIKDVHEFYIKKNEYVLYNIKKFISKYYEPTNVPRGADTYFFERQNCLSNYFRGYNIEPPTNDQLIQIGRDTNLISSFIMLFHKPNWDEKINIWTDPKLTYFIENKIKLREKIRSSNF